MAKEVALKDDKKLTVAEPPKPLVTTPGTISIVIKRPDEIATYEVDADDDAPIEQTNKGRIPIFRILQNGSPQCQLPADGGIPGARAGTIFNTQTKQIYDGRRGLYIIPAYTHLKYIDYIKREPDGTGGGFLGVFEPDDPVVKQAQKERMETHGDLRGPLPHGQTENNKDIELIETYYIDSMCVTPTEDGSFPGEFGRVFRGSFPFSSTNIVSYTGWQEMLKGMTYPVEQPDGPPRIIRPRLYTHVWSLKTKLRKRGAQNWMIWDLSLAAKDAEGIALDYEHSRLLRDNYLYKQAEELRTDILEGSAQLDFAKDTGEGGASTTGQEGNVDDNIPFTNNG